MPATGKKYTAAQKIAYYKKLARGRRGGGRRYGGGMVRPYFNGRGAYTKKRYYGGRRGYGGRRNYSGFVKPITSAVGGLIGGPMGSIAGGLVGDAIKFFTGKGDYTVKNNAFLKDGNFIAMPPIYNKTSGGGVVIRRSEYICDIISAPTANTFKLQSFDINPGLGNTFQWLSQVGGNFEEYVIEGMYFEYRTMSADALNSVNTALGTVVMAADYNAANGNFGSKQEMENYEGGVSCKPSCNMRYFVECARSRTVLTDLYTRTGAVPSGQDQRLYDLANFQIATTGLQGTSVNLGELWVTYQVSLRKPRLNSALGNDIGYAYISTTAGYSNAGPIGTAWTFDQFSTMTSAMITLTATTIVFPFASVNRGFLIQFWWQGASAVTLTFPIPTVSSGMVLFLNSNAPQAGATSVNFAGISYEITIPANMINPTFTLGGAGTLPGGANSLLIIISQVPSNVLN